MFSFREPAIQPPGCRGPGLGRPRPCLPCRAEWRGVEEEAPGLAGRGGATSATAPARYSRTKGKITTVPKKIAFGSDLRQAAAAASSTGPQTGRGGAPRPKTWAAGPAARRYAWLCRSEDLASLCGPRHAAANRTSGSHLCSRRHGTELHLAH